MPKGIKSGSTYAQLVPNLKHITDIYSHPQALGQCKTFIDKHLKHAEQHEVASTSEAASIISKQNSQKSVAISSKLAAKVYELGILTTNMQDQEDNTTRFLTIKKSDSILESICPEEEGRWKALLSFSIEHEVPGALANALSIFSTYRFNLTSINNRPSRARPWHYITLVEFESHGSSLEVRRQIQTMLGALGQVTEKFRFLGNWKA